MSTPTDLERVTYGGPAGSLVKGQHREVIQGVGATRTLLAKESGALCLFDSAAGVVYTLPTAAEGMEFEFETATTITSNSAKVLAVGAFIKGTVQSVIAGSATTLASVGNGTTHVAITSNGTTTGGVIGGRFKLTAQSSGVWLASGFISGSGALATPFATS